jgi:hypothetical protein
MRWHCVTSPISPTSTGYRARCAIWSWASGNSGVKLTPVPALECYWVQAMYSVTRPEKIRRPLVDPAVERTISCITVPGRKHSSAVAAFIRTMRAHRWG